MRTKSTAALTSFVVFPGLFGLFYAIRVLTQGRAIDRWFPGWYQLSIILTIIVLERVYRYANSVSQRPVLGRDILANLTNIYATDWLAVMVFVPVLVFLPQHLWGRPTLVTSSELLG